MECKSFAEFWPTYVREHAHPLNRRLHWLGTLMVLGLAGLAVSQRDWRWCVAMPVLGYGCAWIGHFVVEKNRPATFRHPLWSLRGDFVMFWYICTGRMDAEARRVNAASQKLL